jgi:23S rRNA G2069 N7-methylase RlmK/C1962 C5-methylase RlmI
MSKFTKLPVIQVNSEIEKQILKKHPWIYGNKISGFAKNAAPGKFYQIQNKEGKPICIGIFTPNELVGFRIYTLKENLNSIFQTLKERILQKKLLFSITNSLRLIHGENDFYPGVTADLHNTTIVLRYNSMHLYRSARHLGFWLFKNIKNIFSNLQIDNLILQIPNRGNHKLNFTKNRVLRGMIPDSIEITYRGLSYTINPKLQKGGIYNDIRNLRNYLLDNSQMLHGKIALNLFSNNGLTSLCLEKIGYQKIISLEDSNECLQVAKSNLQIPIHRIEKLDIFRNLDSYLQHQNLGFDLILIDPPSLTASERDVPKAKNLYIRLVNSVLPYLQPNGFLIFASCSARIHVNELERIFKLYFAQNNHKIKKITRLDPEIDHPTIPQFAEGQYFKVLIYQKK